MTSEQAAYLSYTISHFQELARQNRFPENNTIDHETERCVICHPELLPADPFLIYLEVVTQSVKVRRPTLDHSLVDEINSDLALGGIPLNVTFESLQVGKAEAIGVWEDWIRSALSTGLELLSIHSATSRDFDLSNQPEDQEEIIKDKIQEIMGYQRNEA